MSRPHTVAAALAVVALTYTLVATLVALGVDPTVAVIIVGGAGAAAVRIVRQLSDRRS